MGKIKNCWIPLALLASLSACNQLPDPRLDFPVVSEEFVKPVERIHTITPENSEILKP